MRLLHLASLLALTGCNAIFGLDEATARGAGGGGDGGGAGEVCDPFDGGVEPEGELVFTGSFDEWNGGQPVDWLGSGTPTETMRTETCGSALRLEAGSSYASRESTVTIPVTQGQTLALSAWGRHADGEVYTQSNGISLFYDDDIGEALVGSLTFEGSTWARDSSLLTATKTGNLVVSVYQVNFDAPAAVEFDEIRVYRSN